METPNPYTLPTIDFVGGETQELIFNAYFYQGRHPFDLTFCTADFSVVSLTNKNGLPVLTKEMEVLSNGNGATDNVLVVTLDPIDTVELHGKYIYQIQIKDIDGSVEIPKHGILYITNNINKSFIRQ